MPDCQYSGKVLGYLFTGALAVAAARIIHLTYKENV